MSCSRVQPLFLSHTTADQRSFRPWDSGAPLPCTLPLVGSCVHCSVIPAALRKQWFRIAKAPLPNPGNSLIGPRFSCTPVRLTASPPDVCDGETASVACQGTQRRHRRCSQSSWTAEKGGKFVAKFTTSDNTGYLKTAIEIMVLSKNRQVQELWGHAPADVGL